MVPKQQSKTDLEKPTQVENLPTPKSPFPTNREIFVNKVFQAGQKLSFPSDEDQSKDDRSPRTSQMTSPESISGEKEINPRIWISKTVSKILDDKQRSPSTNTDKKRSKSPSSLLEFAQRRLPKWASFIKKSDEETDSPVNKGEDTTDCSRDKRFCSSERSKFTNGTEKNRLFSCKPHSSEDDDVETRRKGILRRTAKEDSMERNDIERFSIPCSSYSSKKSPEFNESRSAMKSYSFSFFKSKDRKDGRSEGKPRHKQNENELSSMPSKDSDKSDISAPILKTPLSENRQRSTRSETRQTSFEEKTKFFTKQKSKEKSNEPSRKNSINFGHLKEKYNRWSKSCRDDGGKAASAETLEGAGVQREGYVQGEFLAASMRIFLVVSPPSTRTQVRSRSLSNLDSIEASKTRLLESHLKMVYGVRNNYTPFSFVSLPELTAKNFHKGLPYQPGSTVGRSAFVRRTHSQLRHTNSQGSSRDYFHLSLPSSFEYSESFDDKTFDYRKFLPNSVFVPAVGNTSLGHATKSALERRKSFNAQISPADYSVRIDGSSQLFHLDSVDVGRLGGRHVVLQENNKLRLFRKSSIEPLKTSDSGRFNGPIESQIKTHDFKTPLSHKLKWSNIFGSRENSINMENLAKILNRMTTNWPKLPPEKEPITLPPPANNALLHIQDVQLEDIMDLSRFTHKEVKRQRTIFELITTEASYISHMKTVVELFQSVALSVQTENVMKEVNLEKLFSNIADVLNANLNFWVTTIYPMLSDAMARKEKFNTQLMYDGFLEFRRIFKPYITYVEAQKSIQMYCRTCVEESSLYAAYLAWCEAQKECKRLRLTDILVKPMQRLTKYTLLLSKIYEDTEYEPERTTLITMYRHSRRFVFDINCRIQFIEDREVVDTLIDNIESYDAVETRDEDIEAYVKVHSDLRLNEKIPGLGMTYYRSLVLEGDVKFKDYKDGKLEIRALLFTDLLLVCAMSKKKKAGSLRVIRPKYMVTNMVIYPQFVMKESGKDVSHIIIIMVDETKTVSTYFSIHEMSGSKEPNPTLKQWLFAFREAQTTMDMMYNMVGDPLEVYYEIDPDNLSDKEAQKQKIAAQEESGIVLDPIEAMNSGITIAAQRRFSTMLYGAIVPIEEFPEPMSNQITRDQVERPGSSRGSQLSSLQQSCSGSYDTSEWGPNKASRVGSADTSIDHRTISMSSDEGIPTIPITADQLICEMNAKTSRARSPGAALAVFPISVHRTAAASATPNTLSVQPTNSQILGQSMPNLTSSLLTSVSYSSATSSTKVCLNVPSRSKYSHGKTSTTRNIGPGTSEKFLRPDTRGTSYPPPSPTRASLRRGFAISSTIKNPPLIKSKQISRDITQLPQVIVPQTQNIAKSLSPQHSTDVYNTSLKNNYLTIPLTSQEPANEQIDSDGESSPMKDGGHSSKKGSDKSPKKDSIKKSKDADKKKK